MRQGHAIETIFPIAADFEYFETSITATNFLNAFGLIYSKNVRSKNTVELLVLNAESVSSESFQEISANKIMVFDGVTYVAGFDYISRLVGFSLANILKYSENTGTTLKALSDMPPQIAAEFINLRKTLVAYEKSHPGVSYNLHLQLQEGGTRIPVKLVSGTQNVYAATSPGLFFRFSRAYREAKKLAATPCGDTVAQLH